MRAYSLTLAGASQHNTFAAGGAFGLERLRLMYEPALGPLRSQLAHEQFLHYVANNSTGMTLGTTSATGDVLPLDGVLASSAHVRWSHRVDRLNIGVRGEKAQLTIGRQTVSWATTLFLTPADPFSPFDPADPFREYRAGIDALRLQLYPSARAEIDAVYRPAYYGAVHTTTALLRAHRTLGAWDLGAWTGALHDRAAGALQVTGTMFGSALRSEIELRRREDQPAYAWRGAIGLDRRVSLTGRDLYVVLEYQHDDLGAANAAALGSANASAYARRGEMQVYGRDVVAVQATWQVHPLVSIDIVTLTDVRDGSVLGAPAIVWSTSQNTSMRAGAYFAIGSEATTAGLPASEFGTVTTSVYLAFSSFF